MERQWRALRPLPATGHTFLGTLPTRICPASNVAPYELCTLTNGRGEMIFGRKPVECVKSCKLIIDPQAATAQRLLSLRFDDRKIRSDFVEHADELAELVGFASGHDFTGSDGVGERRLPDQDRIESGARQREPGIGAGGQFSSRDGKSRVLQIEGQSFANV